MSANCVFSDCPATPTVPLCCAFWPHCGHAGVPTAGPDAHLAAPGCVPLGLPDREIATAVQRSGRPQRVKTDLVGHFPEADHFQGLEHGVPEEVTGVDLVKAQIHAGGRGKAGGVKVVKSIDDVKAAIAVLKRGNRPSVDHATQDEEMRVALMKEMLRVMLQRYPKSGSLTYLVSDIERLIKREIPKQKGKFDLQKKRLDEELAACEQRAKTLQLEQRGCETEIQQKQEQIFEYACHEGNEGMFGTLSGHRANEREAAKDKKGSN